MNSSLGGNLIEKLRCSLFLSFEDLLLERSGLVEDELNLVGGQLEVHGG